MSSLPSRVLAAFLIFSLITVQLPLELHAQAPLPPPGPQQLDQLLAPIALYPDALLAQITTASTNPQEVLDVTNWLAANPYLQGDQLSNAAQQQGFDPAFIALVQFPSVLQMMSENIDDYAAIGAAMTANQAAVSASIQRLRAQAYAAGTLQTNPQQTVVVQQGPQPIYVIQPANPQMVYVPQYDPTMVYVRPSTGGIVAASLISFGVGIGIGALIASHQPWGWGGWGWQWGHGAYYNHAVWGGWRGGYRPPNYWYRPRPIVWTSRPGYGGNWHYRPPNYRPPQPVRPPNLVRPGPGNRPSFSPPPNRPPNGGRPPGNQRPPNQGPPNNGQPNNGYRPGQPNVRPQPGQPNVRPQPGQPQYQRPNNPQTQPPQDQRPNQPQQRPGTVPQPGHPSNQYQRPNNPQSQQRPAPGGQQGGRPAPQGKPTPQEKPQHHEQQQNRPDQNKPNPQ